MDGGRLADELERDLRAVGDRDRAVGAKAYLKSDLEFIGVAAKPLRDVARRFLDRHPDLEPDELRKLVRALWRRPVFESKAVAVGLLEREVASLDLEDLQLVEDLLRRSHTWALVDWMSTKVAAPLVDADPRRSRPILIRWAGDEDFWVRRASMLAQLPALRAGGGDFGLFEQIASSMLGDTEFFIRKAVGWVLRDTAKKRPQLVLGFLDRHVQELSGLTFREAVKYLPEDRVRALQRRRS